MVSALFPLTEEHDLVAGGGEPAEAVRAIAVVRVFEAVNKGGADDRERAGVDGA
jgi:hypothetical protein